MSYIGTEPKDIRSFGRTKFDYTATQGQTAFTGADDDGKVLAFTTGQIEVYVNGILMDDSDFTTTGTGTVTLATAANLNDVINIVSFETNIPDSNYVPASGGTFTGDVDFGANKITYANLYNNVSDLPSASTYHGMFAHVHNTGLAYYSHAGAWIPLANLTGATFSGNIVASDGINIGGTGASNKLDDYEEGAWTPSFSFSSGSVGYSYQSGQYTKIGRKVFLTANLILNSASSPSGGVTVVTLPFAAGTDSNTTTNEGYVTGVTVSIVRNLTSAAPNMRAYIPANTSFMLLTNNHTGQGHVAFDGSLLGSSTLIYMSATYNAAS